MKKSAMKMAELVSKAKTAEQAEAIILEQVRKARAEKEQTKTVIADQSKK